MLTTYDPLPVINGSTDYRSRAQRAYRRYMLELERSDNLRKKLERQRQEAFDKTHCSFCRRPEIVSRNLRLCGECTKAHEAQRREETHEVKPLDPAQGREVMNAYGIETTCPFCGRMIGRGDIACQRHLTIALLRLMQGRRIA